MTTVLNYYSTLVIIIKLFLKMLDDVQCCNKDCCKIKVFKETGRGRQEGKTKKGTDENLKWEAREERGDEYAPGKKKDLEIKASQ